MKHVVYYQNKKAIFDSFSDAYTFCLILRQDGIEYSFRLEGPKFLKLLSH